MPIAAPFLFAGMPRMPSGSPRPSVRGAMHAAAVIATR
jgi:hypothetical protein